MSSHSISKESVDNHYLPNLNIHSPPAPPSLLHPYQRTYGNPVPLGMLAFGAVFLCESLLTLHVGNVHTPNLVLVFAVFYGGISQTLVGMWEMFLGTLFTTYGGFYLSYGAIYMPQIGIAAAYSVDGILTEEFQHAIGIYLGIWGLGALRTTIPTIFTLVVAVGNFACLSANAFTGNPHFATIGGVFGILASFGSFYCAMSSLWTQQTTLSCVRLPPLSVAPSTV
ncbi:hypothetical protein PAXRUDRAFT_795172 [Paxillus rubicundulus Ve08.2h10]|uniref:Uncharacterized protein n=1 Tax=Paxillus rubicundulus Ve08.2h10 TaxID=930991 RepID=A0A0D0E4A0_9AGAM|nr:hypothetical protein PAXRUDRAFT_795172 [Paxillus rubicundulus Ve08.2h10]